jgi:hypothetical protein
METVFEKGSRFIWGNARLLERAIFAYLFLGGSPDRVRSILRLYQNGDGGFGHAIEPDLRTPDSQPVFVEFALRTLYDCKIRDEQMANRACDFLARYADLEHGIGMSFPSAMGYPHAPHMGTPGAQQPSMDRLIGLVGLLNWHGISHPWLKDAIQSCLQRIASCTFDDAHTLLTSFCLLESVSHHQPVDQLYEKLATDLHTAHFFCWDTPVTTYGLTPLNFAPSPGAFCRKIFTDQQINAHLDDLLLHQQADGGWPILWEPPTDMARQEWRAQWTLHALAALQAYGRL